MRRQEAPAIEDGPGALSAPGSAAQLIGGSAANSPALALAAFSNPALRARSLPPRAPLQPIAVWIGRNPAEGQQILEAQEAEQKAAAANTRAAKLEAAKAKRAAALWRRPSRRARRVWSGPRLRRPPPNPPRRSPRSRAMAYRGTRAPTRRTSRPACPKPSPARV
ncbi:hypothetical protein ACU4GR_11005 [Methylobacterium oryzae CBMB20]